MKTNDLISQLSADVQPVKPWKAPWRITLAFTTLSLVIVAGLLIMTGPRQDFEVKLQDPFFWMGLLSWTLFFILGLKLTFTLATPGRRVSGALWGGFSLVLLAVLGWHLHELLTMDISKIAEGMALEGVRCSLVTVVTSLIVGSFVIFKARRGASGRPLLSSFIVGAVSLAVGGLLISLNCGNDNGMHIVLWHFLIPGLFIGAMVMALIRKLLRW